MKLRPFLLILASTAAGLASASGQTITIPTLTVDHITHVFASSQSSDILASGNAVGGSVQLPNVTVEPGSYSALNFTLQAPVGQQFKVSAVGGLQPTFLINFLPTTGNNTGLISATTKTMTFTNLSGTPPGFVATGLYVPSGAAYYLDGSANATVSDWFFTSFTYSLTFPTVTYGSETVFSPVANSRIQGIKSGAVDGAPTGGWVTLVPMVAIPEPSTWGLILSLGVGMLVLLRRRHLSQQHS